MDKNTILISAAVLLREQSGKIQWFISKESNNDGWEFPNVLVRKGESSVRAILRIMGEKGGMTTRVLEEVGRNGGVRTINNKTQAQRQIYYLMLLKSSSKDAIGFSEYLWLEYAKASRKLGLKRERAILKNGREVYKRWKKERQNRKKQQ
jgi:hypothetical protein